MTTPQQKLQALLNDATAHGRECGIRVCAYLHGEPVLDAWAGHTAPDHSTSVTDDTLFPVFSVTKGIASTAVHVLAERGIVDYDAPVAHYWPAFAAGGKEGITLRHALSHTAGLYNMPVGSARDTVLDWGAMCGLMAGEAPAHAPGGKCEYHAVTFSWVACEPVCRADGRDFGTIVRDEVARPLGLEREMYVGLPASEDARVAVLDEPAPNPGMLEPGDEPRSIPAWMCPLHAWMNTLPARRACIPASNGIMTARAMARHYASLLPDGAEGTALLAPERMRTATAAQVLNDGTACAKSLGYQVLGGPDSVFGPAPTVFGHGGYGGSLGFVDPDTGLAVGLTKNLFSARGVQEEAVKLVREVLL